MKKIIILILMMLPISIFCTENEAKDNPIEVKEHETIDFKQIKQVLKIDQLDTQAQKKTEEVKKIVEEKKKVDTSRYDIPAKDELWSFLSEFWIVKNAPILKWDIQKPDYGLQDYFANFLEKMGHYEKRFKILIVDTPNVYHFALPSNPGEFIFVLSLPFIRNLDLTKQEISLLLFEDFLRLKLGYFEKFVTTKPLQEIIGSNFSEKKLDKKIFEDVFKKYDEMIFDVGFNFEQQFEVTSQMNNTLRSDLSLWNAYANLLKKIDELVKGNILYTKYSKIYPSPELQLGWLLPKEKKI